MGGANGLQIRRLRVIAHQIMRARMRVLFGRLWDVGEPPCPIGSMSLRRGPLRLLQCNGMAAHPARTQPFSIRLGSEASALVSEEMRRSGHSRSAVVEELAEEAAKMRLHPGVAFRGRPRRAWVIGSGLDVWESIELLRSYHDDEAALLESHPSLSARHLRTAQAYAERFPVEIQTMLADSRRPLAQLRELYPFLQTAPKSS